MVTAENLNTGALSSWSQIGRVVMQCKVLLQLKWSYPLFSVTRVGFVQKLQQCGRRGSSEQWNGKNAVLAAGGEFDGCAECEGTSGFRMWGFGMWGHKRIQNVRIRNCEGTSRSLLQPTSTLICSLFSVWEENCVQETHPSPKTQRIAAEVCNHDSCSMITYFDKVDLKTWNARLKWFNYFDKCRGKQNDCWCVGGGQRDSF